MDHPKVCILTLNWNGLEDTIECLESLRKITYPNYGVIVVDNGSEGNDAQVLEDRFGDYIHLIKLDQNYGYYHGANIGIKYALDNSQPDYFLFLDNDTVVDPGFLTEMVKVADADPAIGIAGAKIYCYDEPNRLQYLGGEINPWKVVIRPLGILKKKVIDRGQNDSTKEVEHIALWCALVNRKVLESIGLFEGKPFREYVEYAEVDYFLRAKKVGVKMVYIPRAKVWHKSSSEKKVDGLMQYRGLRSRFRFMRQHTTKWQYRCFLIYFFGVHFWLATAYYLIWLRRPRMLFRFYKGIRDGLFHSDPGKSLKE